MFTTSFKSIQPCPLPANLVLLCYYCSLLSPCLVCMLRMLRCYPLTPWFGISHYYICRDPGLAYVIPVTMQSHGEPRTVPTCLSRQGQAQNVLGKHREGHPIQAG